MFLDFDWSSGERELVDMIRALHGEGLHIVLKPCLTSLDSAWMGAVTFPGKEQEQIQGVKQRYAEEWFAPRMSLLFWRHRRGDGMRGAHRWRRVQRHDKV